MDELMAARLMVAALAAVSFLCGVTLLIPQVGTAVLHRLPRAKVLGIVLSTLCWAWVAVELIVHPVDLLAFLTPTLVVVLAVGCLIGSWVFLENLLCARAIGGLLMLWPMPVILAVREQVTLWREVPVVAGYLSLTFGMIVVFYPWVFRACCERMAERPAARVAFAVFLLLTGALAACAAYALGATIGEVTVA